LDAAWSSHRSLTTFVTHLGLATHHSRCLRSHRASAFALHHQRRIITNHVRPYAVLHPSSSSIWISIMGSSLWMRGDYVVLQHPRRTLLRARAARTRICRRSRR
jgi:hypothetical protein